MPMSDLELQPRRLPAPLPIWQATTSVKGWSRTARTVATQGGRLVSMWAAHRPGAEHPHVANAAYALSEGLLWLALPLGPAHPMFPDLSADFPCAGRLQRAMADLSGVHAQGSTDHRP
ncbi:MAG: Ni,Fe-hydrogenase III large subunit, partial [Aquabacterium sp.]|nr:Ni,Fe-hydrogenase III large subunit [Aquabacterium sp.]